MFYTESQNLGLVTCHKLGEHSYRGPELLLYDITAYYWGVFTPIAHLLWSQSVTNLLQRCMLPRVWIVFTGQYLQADQNV